MWPAVLCQSNDAATCRSSPYASQSEVNKGKAVKSDRRRQENGYLPPCIRIHREIILPQNHTLIPVDIPSPDAVHLPKASTFCRAISTPSLTPNGVEYAMGREAGRDRE